MPSPNGSETNSKKVVNSCAECKRSKLKCDRTVPCQACIRRNCASICPNGVMTATKGNKALMAHAQKLDGQVKALSARTRHLEAALARAMAMAHASTITDLSNTCHVVLNIEDEGMEELETGPVKTLETILQPEEHEWRSVDDEEDLGLPYEVMDLMHSFPHGAKSYTYPKLLFVPFIPSQDRARRLATVCREINWLDPIIDDGFDEIFASIYHDNNCVDIDGLHPHALAIFFMAMAEGAAASSDNQFKATQEEASRYVVLAKAAVSLVPMAQEVSTDTVQALLMIVRFIYTTYGVSTEQRWLLIGLCVRVAQRLGLHRDGAGWHLSEAEQRRRRVMFWELYCVDLWTSLLVGRPPTLLLQHIDCRFPDDDSDAITSSTGSWHSWKYRFFADCISTVSQHCFNVRPPAYAAVLETDKMIRKHPLPSQLQPPAFEHESDSGLGFGLGNDVVWSSDPRKGMRQGLGACMRESSIMYLHKMFFGLALSDESSGDVLEHKFAFSVLAQYRSAVRLMAYVKGTHERYRELARRCWILWSPVVASCIPLAAIVTMKPGCVLAPGALRELERAARMFAEGSEECRPAKSMGLIENLLERSRQAFASRPINPVPSTSNNALDIAFLASLGEKPRDSTTLPSCDMTKSDMSVLSKLSHSTPYEGVSSSSSSSSSSSGSTDMTRYDSSPDSSLYYTQPVETPDTVVAGYESQARSTAAQFGYGPSYSQSHMDSGSLLDPQLANMMSMSMMQSQSMQTEIPLPNPQFYGSYFGPFSTNGSTGTSNGYGMAGPGTYDIWANLTAELGYHAEI